MDDAVVSIADISQPLHDRHGLYADHHGIVHNTMRDSTLGSFSLNNTVAVRDGAWWGGEPVWVSAERAGLPTATYFWPGSEAVIRGVRPTRTTVYDGKVPVNERIDTVLGWLSESAATRPRFVTAISRRSTMPGTGMDRIPWSCGRRCGWSTTPWTPR